MTRPVRGPGCGSNHDTQPEGPLTDSQAQAQARANSQWQHLVLLQDKPQELAGALAALGQDELVLLCQAGLRAQGGMLAGSGGLRYAGASFLRSWQQGQAPGYDE